MIRSIVSFILIGVFATIGVVGVQFIKTHRILLKPKGIVEHPPVSVEYYKVAPVAVSAKSVAKGVIEAYRTLRVSPEISGKAVYVNESAVMGYMAKQDELLVRLDTTLLELDKKNLEVNIETSQLSVELATLEVERGKNEIVLARENLQIVESIYKRNLELFQNGSLAKNALDLDRLNFLNATRSLQTLEDSLAISLVRVTSAKVNVRSLQAQLEKVVATIAKSEIYTPWPSLVSKRNVEHGEFVSPSSQLFTLTRCDKLYFTAAMPAEEFACLKKGVSGSIRLYDMDDSLLNGVVEDLGVDADQRSRSYSVRLTVDLADFKNSNLRPGFFGEVTIPLETRRYEVAVPSRAVLNDGGRPFVYVIEEGIAKLRYIKTARSRNGFVEVSDGLALNEIIVASGVERVITGIRVVEETAIGVEQEAGIK